MDRLKASDFPPEVLKLFDGYVHGWLSRRDFLDRAGKYAVGGLLYRGLKRLRELLDESVSKLRIAEEVALDVDELSRPVPVPERGRLKSAMTGRRFSFLSNGGRQASRPIV